jgi:dihydropteroate synthase
MLLHCRHHRLDLSTPIVMGILNVTPDSFSDGGRFVSVRRAIEHGIAMAEAGAGMIDVGGESTRPGAQAVGEQEEIDRVAPVIAALTQQLTIPVSIDTSKPGVMTAALQVGAALINDVRALQEPDALAVAAASDAAICLMHMQGAPRTMQQDPHYADVVREVREFLDERVAACERAGIERHRILLDPGIGFGKRLAHNLQLLAHLPALQQSGLPMLVGVSRKSLFGELLQRSVEQRLAGGLAVATAAVLAGVSILRVHDVAETVDAVKVATALKASGYTLR